MFKCGVVERNVTIIPAPWRLRQDHKEFKTRLYVVGPHLRKKTKSGLERWLSGQILSFTIMSTRV